MKHRKMVLSNLMKNSIAAYFGAVEIHNKPNILYRYETTTLLLMNSWELILKAYIRKRIKKQSIYTRDGHTISLDKALNYVEAHINSQEPKSFSAVKENLCLIEEYRNNIVHYYNENLEPYIFMLVAKAALNYVEFVKKYFEKDILNEEGLYILPLGFKLPFRPEKFLSRREAQSISSPESRRFINSIVRVIDDLDEKGVEDTIVVGFDIYLENVKKLKNSDLRVAITNIDEADAKIAKVQKVNLSDDPCAQRVSVSDDEMLKKFPLGYKSLCEKCRKRIPGFKQGKKFNGIMKRIKQKGTCAYVRRLDPQNEDSGFKMFYSNKAIDEIKKAWLENGQRKEGPNKKQEIHLK